MAAPRTPIVPTETDLISRARALVPRLRTRSADISEARHVPAEVMALLGETGLMQLARPARYGGPDIGAEIILNVTRTLAEGDGSTAWVYGVTNSHDHLVGMYPQEVQDGYWASGQPLCASSYQPQGNAVRADGGYRLSGRWSFCSGIDHCGWIVAGVLVRKDAAQAPSLLLFLLRKDELSVVVDWYMMGLAGTGSKTIVAEDLFVPDERILDNDDVVRGTVPGAAVHANPLYGTSIWLLFGFSILALATGILRGAYEAAIADSRAKIAAGDPFFAARKPHVQARLADVGVLLESCDLLFETSLRETALLVAQRKNVS